MIKFKTIQIIILLLAPFNIYAENEIQKRTRLSDTVTLLAAEELCKSYSAEVIGIGGSTFQGVRSIDISLMIDKVFTIEEARRMVVCCEEILLRTINSYTEIRPYLVEFPFRVTRATVSISSKNPPQNAPDVISHVRVGREMIYYDSTNETSKFVEVHSEPYEFALQLVRKELRNYQQN